MNEVRTDIPIDVHPDAIGKDLDVDHPLATKAKAAAKEALSVAYDVHGAINDTENQLRALASPDAPVYMHGHQLLREHGAEEQLAKAAEQSTQRALQTIERRVREVESYRQTLLVTVNASLDHSERKTPTGVAEATEVRAYLRSLPETERVGFVHEAINHGDIRTVAAVLHSPSYLSGLSPEHHERAKLLAARSFAPTESRLLDATGKVVERMKRGAETLTRRTAEVTGIASARAAKRQSALEKLAAGGK